MIYLSRYVMHETLVVQSGSVSPAADEAVG